MLGRSFNSILLASNYTTFVFQSRLIPRENSCSNIEHVFNSSPAESRVWIGWLVVCFVWLDEPFLMLRQFGHARYWFVWQTFLVMYNQMIYLLVFPIPGYQEYIALELVLLYFCLAYRNLLKVFRYAFISYFSLPKTKMSQSLAFGIFIEFDF